jgi:dipeptidyl aminopeptidase/acylaminoacyl peptidase
MISGEDQRFQEVAHTEDLADVAAWSPDGTALALVVQGYNAGDKATLVIVPAGGGAPRTVAGPRFPCIFNVQWSPDGKRLAYDG